jgi:hypothetical protein
MFAAFYIFALPNVNIKEAGQGEQDKRQKKKARIQKRSAPALPSVRLLLLWSGSSKLLSLSHHFFASLFALVSHFLDFRTLIGTQRISQFAAHALH